MEMIQYITVGIVVVAAVAYLDWRSWQSLSGRGDPCAGCEGCALKDLKRQSECGKIAGTGGAKKKKEEKFGEKE